jgi:hypothetical protein
MALVVIAALASAAIAPQKIYWADEVPPGWSGQWPTELQTIAERSKFTRTMTSLDNLEFMTALRGRSARLRG